jgi:Skp family chaperone for outer membrane proteins
MEAHRDAMMAEQEKLKKAFETARDEALNKALSEAGREEKMTAAQQKLAVLTEFTQKARQTAMDERKELAERKSRMQSRIVDKIRDSVKQLAASRGIELVLDSSALGMSGVEAVLFTADSLDLTDAVIAAIAGGKDAAGAGDAKNQAPGTGETATEGGTRK